VSNRRSSGCIEFAEQTAANRQTLGSIAMAFSAEFDSVQHRTQTAGIAHSASPSRPNDDEKGRRFQLRIIRSRTCSLGPVLDLATINNLKSCGMNMWLPIPANN